MMFLMLDDINALYDNSKPFSTFLMKEGLEGILRETELGLREKHTIVPHVCFLMLSQIYYLFAFRLILYLCSVTWYPCKRLQMHCLNSPMTTAGIITCGDMFLFYCSTNISPKRFLILFIYRLGFALAHGLYAM